jgi:serine/threonine-protein kinase HSL1 (negative regulator of Swe1 kinase)
MEYSVSDYHHAPPRPVTRRSSTRVSLQGGHRRQSQYSILEEDMPRTSQSYREASVAETEESYDPFRTSRNQIAQRQADHARITVLRGASNTSRTQRPSGINVKRASLRKTSTKRNAALGSINDDVYSIPSSPPVMHSAGPSQTQKLRNDRRVSSGISRRSFVSNVSSGRPAPVRKSISYKRGVSFVHTRGNQRSTSAQKHNPMTLQERYIKDRPQHASSLPSLLTKESPAPTIPQVVRSKKTPTDLTEAQLIAAENARPKSHIWKDDARKVSTELEKFCDEAFNRSSMASTAATAHTVMTDPPERSYESPTTSVSILEDVELTSKHQHQRSRRPAQLVRPVRPSDLQRPLPEPPVPEPEHLGSYTKHELARTRDLLKQRAADPRMAMAPGCLDDVIAHLDRLMQPSTVRANEQRRHVSTPDPNSPAMGRSKDTFDSLLEKGNIGFRSASEPVRGYADSPRRRRYADKDTLRLVQQSGEKPISPTKPLTIRKKSGSSTPSPLSVRTRGGLPSHFTNPDDIILNEERRIAGLSQLVETPLESIDEDKENFDPLPRNPKPFSGEFKKRNWFRRQQQAQRTPESSDKRPPPPLKDLQPLQGHRDASPEKKRTSDVPSWESQTSEPKKLQPKAKGKFFKIFSKHKHTKPDGKSGGKSLSISLPLSTYISLLMPADYDLHSSASLSSTTTSPSSYLMSGALPPNQPKPNPRSTLSTISNVAPGPPRVIQPHQNWLARFLRVKPAVATMCFQVSKVRARREIASLLREWRKYGIRDIVVDKNTSRIWAKVARTNCKFSSYLLFASFLFRNLN